MQRDQLLVFAQRESFFRAVMMERAEQASRDSMSGMTKYSPHFALFDNFSVLKHRDPVAEGANNVHLMGDQHDGQTKALVDLFKQFQHRMGIFRVEGRCGFVAQQDLRLRDQRAGDTGTLLLAAGKLGRPAVAQGAEADQRQDLINPFLPFRARYAGHFQRQLNVLRHRFGRH